MRIWMTYPASNIGARSIAVVDLRSNAVLGGQALHRQATDLKFGSRVRRSAKLEVRSARKNGWVGQEGNKKFCTEGKGRKWREPLD